MEAARSSCEVPLLSIVDLRGNKLLKFGSIAKTDISEQLVNSDFFTE